MAPTKPARAPPELLITVLPPAAVRRNPGRDEVGWSAVRTAQLRLRAVYGGHAGQDGRFRLGISRTPSATSSWVFLR
jgi:hypothetical protein